MQMVMTSDETQIQIFVNWPMSHAKRVTRDNRIFLFVARVIVLRFLFVKKKIGVNQERTCALS